MSKLKKSKPFCERLLSPREAGEICGVSYKTVWEWLNKKLLKGVQISPTHRKVCFSELALFSKERKMYLNMAALTGKVCVLVVDSDEAAASELAGILQANGGYEVVTVHSAFEAGLMAMELFPQAMLVSLGRGDINAKTVCETNHRDPCLSLIKNIAVADELSPSESEDLLRKGFDGCISRPFNAGEVLGEVENIMAA